MSIFILCNNLETSKKHINIIKISSHKGEHGNQIADKLTKEAANTARMCKFGDSRFIKYDMAKNPINVETNFESVFP